MGKRIFILLIVLMSVSLIGIILIQSFFIFKNYEENDKQFSINVNYVLEETASIVERNEFRKYVWLSIADLVGIIFGSILAIISFSLVIYSYEKRLPKPKSILPPTENELKHSAKIISLNLGDEV